MRPSAYRAAISNALHRAAAVWARPRRPVSPTTTTFIDKPFA
jgi:hypothetical protein